MENQNSVCYVAKINEVRAIEGADNIELVIAGGWNAITKKGEFKEGDLTVIATTDAVIPEKLSEKMGVANYLRKGNRVRTVKLRGVYSECLIIPIIYAKAKSIVEGNDLMEELGITKYEPPVKQVQLSSGRKIKWRDNQNFHIYYKFPNLKNVPGLFTEEDEVQITRKIHGTNARYGIVKKSKLTLWDRLKKFLRLADEWIEYEYIYGSHNCEKGSDSQGFYSTDVWRTISEDYGIKKRLWNFAKKYSVKDLGSGLVLYGEIYGAGIQKNYEYGLKDTNFVGFDITIDGKYLAPETTQLVTVCHLELSHVKVLYNGPWSQDVQDSFVFGNFIKDTKVPEEGIVIKHVSGERNKVAKVINPEYLTFDEKHNLEEGIEYTH